MLDKYIAFIKAHEFLATLALIGFLAIHFSDVITTVVTQHDTARLSTAQAALASQVQSNAQLASQYAALQKQFAQSVSQIRSVAQQTSNVPAQIAAIPVAQRQ